MARLTDFRILSFDVYGTLIDWETGVVDGLRPLLESNGAQQSREELLSLYHELERTQQAKTPDMRYHQLLTTIHPQIAARLGLPQPAPEQDAAFGESVGQWPAFPDTVNALKELGKFYKLVVLSNVDLESFSKTNAGPLEGVPFDLVITAQEVGTYKPDLQNFEYMLERVHAEFGTSKDQVLQTAQSQFHDHHPAKKLGIKSCWIERPGAIMGNREDVVFDWKLDTLGAMAEELEHQLNLRKHQHDKFR